MGSVQITTFATITNATASINAICRGGAPRLLKNIAPAIRAIAASIIMEIIVAMAACQNGAWPGESKELRVTR
jgi:hypothetical protein